jgi:hypothetical protein
VLPVGFVHEQIGTADLGLIFRYGSDPKSRLVPLSGLRWNQILEEIKLFATLIKDYQAFQEGSKEAVQTNSVN